MHIDGGGLVEGTHIYFHAVNCTIDPAGVMSASTYRRLAVCDVRN